MLKELIPVVWRSACAYILLLLLGRIAGRKMLSHITFFDFIIGITFGSLATRISLGPDNSLQAGVVSAVVITLLTLITDFWNLKSPRFRKLEEGKPVVLISGGQILNQNLKKVRISMEKLSMLLRQKNVFQLSDVNFAVLENDGQLSVLLKLPKQPLKAEDLNLQGKSAALACDLISDGKILYPQLHRRGLDRQWLLDQLELQDVHDVCEVFYAGIEPSGSFYVSRKTENKE